ncbi:DUF4350 domain-containing protein [Flavobacterium psychrotrophum]|uniref:DUF4350 domain-containing protein n=1 Tax=Flavobacterium psychrotrophum TaxID=2294119 RepID=UPI000E3177ED|nr:DUF4350 domain-containing protein [Flavobacterium psychrotrophum]
MKKALITIFSIIAVFVVIAIIADAYEPKQLNWRPSYSINNKIPLGLYVLNEEAPDLFKGDTIEKISISPYEYLEEDYDYETNTYYSQGTYLNIYESNDIDRASAKELLNYAAHGNTVLLSMNNFPEVILDTLGLSIRDLNPVDSIALTFDKNSKNKYWYKEGHGHNYFDSLATGNDSIAILGYQHTKDTVVPNYVQAKFGYGRILLHTQPQVFTNYYLLTKNTWQYAEAIAAKIPTGRLLWQVGNATAQNRDTTLTNFLEQPAFSSFWYLGLLALIVFIFFNARRRQRVVPVIHPVTNTTIDFTKTIGNLYFQEGNHHTIIDKKIIYFLEKVRTDYLIDTYSLDDAFVERLHQKTGKSIQDIQQAVSLIKKHRQQILSSEADVIAINNAIEKLRL